MSKTTLQVPLDTTLRDGATKVAQEMGFSSLQEAVRVLLKQLTDRKIGLSIVREPQVEYLTPKQEAILTKKSAQVDKEIENGDYFVANSAEELIEHLESL